MQKVLRYEILSDSPPALHDLKLKVQELHKAGYTTELLDNVMKLICLVQTNIKNNPKCCDVRITTSLESRAQLSFCFEFTAFTLTYRARPSGFQCEYSPDIPRGWRLIP